MQKTSVHDKNVNTCTPKQMVFWHVFESIWFLQLEEDMVELKTFSHGLFQKGTKKQIRYRFQLVIIYLFPNEIISSTIVYDQDANRSRGFILVGLGAPLNFIVCFIRCLLFVDIWICTWICFRILFKKGYMDLYLDLFQDIIQKRLFHFLSFC